MNSKWKNLLWKGYIIQLYHTLENINYTYSKQISGCQRFTRLGECVKHGGIFKVMKVFLWYCIGKHSAWDCNGGRTQNISYGRIFQNLYIFKGQRMNQNEGKFLKRHILDTFDYVDQNYQEAFNRRLPVCCFGSVLWSLLIPKYSGIKRRGTPFPGLRNAAFPLLFFFCILIFFIFKSGFRYGDKYPLPSYEP